MLRLFVLAIASANVSNERDFSVRQGNRGLGSNRHTFENRANRYVLLGYAVCGHYPIHRGRSYWWQRKKSSSLVAKLNSTYNRRE